MVNCAIRSALIFAPWRRTLLLHSLIAGEHRIPLVNQKEICKTCHRVDRVRCALAIVRVISLLASIEVNRMDALHVT